MLECGVRETDTQTQTVVTNIHFAVATPHAKSDKYRPNVVLCVVDRDLTTSKRKTETDVNSQRSVIDELKGRITMLENILAKEAVVLPCLTL